MLLGATILATNAVPAFAQDTTDEDAVRVSDQVADVATTAEDDAIVVTGFRRSLLDSTNAKREATGFVDSVFAEDIGKFPDTNIAESFNRIPGVTISREITGEGLQISIRGLGTNFTRVLLNNAPVAIASTGRTDAQSANREVDLDLFPTELFTQLTVNKSPTASMLEGGAAGTVNMRSARPFDNDGTHVTYSFQGTRNSVAEKWGYRGSLLASATFNDSFGILAGVAGVKNKVRVTGFETIGWTNPNLSATQNTAANRNNTGGGNWTIPGTVPSNAGIPGVAPGTVIDQAFLLAQNPGASITQIDNGIIPRLGRPADEFGDKDRLNAIVSLEFRPSDAMRFYVDGMWGKKENDLERIDMNWVGRNGAVIPVNTTYDREDCSQGCVVTGGTYYNAQWFLEYRPFIEDVEFWGVNPGVEWDINDALKFSLNANWTESKFHRESPTVLVITPANSGVTVNYSNDGGDFPQIETNIDLNDPASFGWPGGRVNIQDERRRTETKGVRGDLVWEATEWANIGVGAAYDDVSRRIRAFDNSQAWQNAVCGNQPSVFLPGPNTQPPCQGLNAPGAAPAGYPTYPAFGTGFTAGQTGPVTYLGSLIPQSALAGYLMPGPSGFITVDWDRFRADSNYDEFHDSAPEAGGSNTGASGGLVREKTLGVYGEVNGEFDIADMRLRYNAGLRWVETRQSIGGRVTIADPRNSQDPDGAGPLPAACPGAGNVRDGSCFPNIVNFVVLDNKYDNWLPSGSAALNITDNVIARASVSRTMTRPDPSAMLPGLNFGSPSADVGTVGNSALEPYKSFNIDLGFEYYTGAEGFVGVAAFRKALTGFTVLGANTVPFSFLEQYGVTFDTLNPTQQAAINSRGGPGAATVVLQQQVNAEGTLKVNGLEFTWVQPLDFLLGRFGLDGFGFNANLTLVDQKGTGAAPAVALGVSDVTYNITAYYENHGVSARVSTTFNRGAQVSGSNQNGIPAAALFTDDYQQWDFSGRLDLAEIFGNNYLPELTLDVINITKEYQRSYFQFDNAAFTFYEPGRTILIGFRGSL
jgi:TonB-dependent receptor